MNWYHIDEPLCVGEVLLGLQGPPSDVHISRQTEFHLNTIGFWFGLMAYSCSGPEWGSRPEPPRPMPRAVPDPDPLPLML